MLRRALEPGTALIDFFVHRVYEPARREEEKVVQAGSWSDWRLSAWITRPEREAVVGLDLGSASELAKQVSGFLAELVSRRGQAPDGASTKSAANDLRATLWDPIAKHLDGISRVFVSPDGFLGTLPFETLSLEDGTFLLERYDFVYTQSPSSLANERAPTTPLDSLLAVGGVDYSRRAESQHEAETAASALRGSFETFWAPLRHTEYESDVVNGLHELAFPTGHRALLQKDAPTEERLKQELPQHSVLHVATHGFFNPEGLPSLWQAALEEAGKESPQLSEEGRQLVGKAPGLLTGLVCAGVNADAEGGRDDGYLTAEEVGWLDLSKVELVVLSACETALGRAESGEGLLGLRRAFEMAGAKTVISSLWSVKDESTAKLMQGFYENLWRKKMGRADALRTAQLEMLARNRAQFHDALPSTWGAFVLSGEWR